MKKTPAKKERLLYEESYRKGAATIRECYLPNLLHVDGAKFMVHSGEILKAGRMECADGVRREFQVIRFLLSERRELATPLDAVDPSVASTGTPSTRDKNSSSLASEPQG